MRPSSLIITNSLSGTKEVVLKDSCIYSDKTIKNMITDVFYKYYKDSIPFSVEFGYYTSSEV